jgi:hypothetical protein
MGAAVARAPPHGVTAVNPLAEERDLHELATLRGAVAVGSPQHHGRVTVRPRVTRPVADFLDDVTGQPQPARRDLLLLTAGRGLMVFVDRSDAKTTALKALAGLVK